MNSIFESNTKKGSGNKTSDFRQGMEVIYIQVGKEKTPLLSDCEPGKVSAVSESYVHVLFWDSKTRKYRETSNACYPHCLWARDTQ